MAKRRRTRRKARMVYLPFELQIVLSTGADNSIQVVSAQTLTQEFDIYGVRAAVSFAGTTVGEAPIEAGFAQSELTGAQILEQRDASPTSQYDVVANEQARRKVRNFGSSSGIAGGEALNDGKPIWRKMFVKVPSGRVLLDFYTVNRSGATLTTGQTVTFIGDIVGQWK